MRIKLDENLPVPAAEPLRSAGHDVDSVVQEGLGGATDAEVPTEATSNDRLVVTLDRGLRRRPGAPARAHMQASSCCASRTRRLRAVVQEVQRLVDAVDIEGLSGCVTVFRAGTIRVRRPGS
ncbi:MAG: DUF5615 family PIN-like protein [Actinobacteria bacterium]|nr:DUF5615 family PIN-like protein [Actinomycetota bacterium]